MTLALLALIGLLIAPLSYTAGLVLRSEDALAPLVQGIALPLLNPLTHAVDAARALFNGDWGNREIALGVGITTALAVVAVWLASRAFSRANA